MLFVGLVFLVANILLAVLPVFIGMLVGVLATQPVNENQAILLVIILIICSTGHDLTWRAGELAFKKYLLPVSYLYENQLFRKIISKPYPYFVNKFTGKISSYIGTISLEMRGLLESVFYNYISQVVNLVAILLIFATINWQTTAIFVVSLCLMLLIGRKTVKNSLKYEHISADVMSTKNGKVFDAIANFVNVKSFQKESYESENIELEQVANLNAASRSFYWSIFFWGTMSFFVRNVIWPLTIMLNVYLFIEGQLSIAQLATILTTILLFSATIWDVIWQLSQFNLKRSRVEEAHEYLFGKTLLDFSTTKPESDAIGISFEKRLDIRNLSFAYPDKKDVPVLKGINLDIRKHEKIGIVGKSGSGKTTITKILLGYYGNFGEIIVDGAPIKTTQLASIISYVPQDTSLFHRTVADNIAYAAGGNTSRQEITNAAIKANADEFISKIEGGYDALVGERGVKLSAGQRQRIAIARAFLDDKPLLILDEATSALDSESEVLIQDALEKLWKEKTVIAIAHRLSTLRNMDRIIVLGDGCIQEQGTHSQLLNKKGLYASLWKHQSGGFLEEE